jgi:tryptophanyl-tRNA synthetase
MAKQRVLSGMQASGLLHLGNYHGALENWVRLQDEYECFFFVADWHALTTLFQDPGKIREHTREIVLDFLACGLDPERSAIFVQSEVLQHAELFTLLSMLTPVPWLERVPTYKDKQRDLATSGKDLSSFGFLGYPVLQAADISIYDANYVPVGEDQLPHLELTREIVRRFNFLYGDCLVEPKALLTRHKVLPGLDGRKMSKSYGNAVYLSDDDQAVRQKLMNAVTDPQRQRRKDPGRPEVCNVFAYHRLYAPAERLSQIDDGCRKAEIGCVDCKKELVETFFRAFGDIRARRQALARDPGRVRQILDAGAARAREVAEGTMTRVREAMQMGWRP